MFEKILKTEYPPRKKPVMVWDGTCGFCQYWTTRWQRFTKDKIGYDAYQDCAHYFKDIDVKHFKQASRLIEKDGTIYSGPRSAYRTFTYGSKWAFLDSWYVKYTWFEKLSDGLYNWVANNRSMMFKITKALFGTNPEEPRPFWVVYLMIVLYLIYIFV